MLYLILLACANLLVAGDIDTRSYFITPVPGRTFQRDISFQASAIKVFKGSYRKKKEAFVGEFEEDTISCQKCEHSGLHDLPVKHFFGSIKKYNGQKPTYHNYLISYSVITSHFIGAVCGYNNEKEQFKIVKNSFRGPLLTACFMDHKINAATVGRNCQDEIEQYSGRFHDDRFFLATHSIFGYETLLAPYDYTDSHPKFLTDVGNQTKAQFDIVKDEFKRRKKEGESKGKIVEQKK